MSFNSIPYMGYTLTALMNLEAFRSEEVRAVAREILDREIWSYALGEARFPPVRTVQAADRERESPASRLTTRHPWFARG